jgi:hypothetical protein
MVAHCNVSRIRVRDFVFVFRDAWNVTWITNTVLIARLSHPHDHDAQNTF